MYICTVRQIDRQIDRERENSSIYIFIVKHTTHTHTHMLRRLRRLISSCCQNQAYDPQKSVLVQENLKKIGARCQLCLEVFQHDESTVLVLPGQYTNLNQTNRFGHLRYRFYVSYVSVGLSSHTIHQHTTKPDDSGVSRVTDFTVPT